MSKMVYVAHPIDSMSETSRNHYVNQVRETLAQLFDNDWFFYIPSRAWAVSPACKTDPRLQNVNDSALAKADALVVILTNSDSSLGCGVEMERFAASGKPVVIMVMSDVVSWVVSAMEHRPNVKTLNYTRPDWHHALATFINRPWDTTDTSKAIRFNGKGKSPVRAYRGDAGFDLKYCGQEKIVISPGGTRNIPSCVSVEWPDDVWGFIIGRSSSYAKHGLLVHQAVIDSGYRGDLFVIVTNVNRYANVVIEPDQRVGQVLLMPNLKDYHFQYTDGALNETDRQKSGYGSSGD